MRGRQLALGLVVAIGALAALWLWGRPGPTQVVQPGEPLPFERPVERHFVDEETGEVDTWKLEKKTTSREESLAVPPLPEPDPEAGRHVPDESARTLDGMALEAWKGGDIQQAVELFEEAIETDPDDRVPRSHLGRLLTLMTDYATALPHLERAAQLAPEDPQVWLDLQTLFERRVLITRANEARQRAEALAGGRRIYKDTSGAYLVEGGESFP